MVTQKRSQTQKIQSGGASTLRRGPDAHRRLPTAHSSPLTTHRLLPTAHCQPLTVHHSLLTAHRSLLTAHFPSPHIHPDFPMRLWETARAVRWERMTVPVRSSTRYQTVGLPVRISADSTKISRPAASKPRSRS